MTSADHATKNSERPRVSVVMATYNYGQFITYAIQSVVNQTFTDWELVIVDDGSKDDTSNVVERHLSDQRIRYYFQPNRGQPHAKNAGIGLSRGQLIAFLDADDAWLPTKLAKQVRLFDNDPDLGVVYSRRFVMDAFGKVLTEELRDMARGDVLKEAIQRTIPPFSSTLVRREVFENVGMFDESIPVAIDYDLWLRVALKYRFDYVDEPLLLYRTGHANLSKRSVERLEIVLHRILPKFLSDDSVKERVGNKAIRGAYAAVYSALARNVRRVSIRKAIVCHLIAIRYVPFGLRYWHKLGRCCMPDYLAKRAKAVFK
jgi:glycosyltransferase involved in cell wall biosynthesis